ncbi:hypothetical protein ACHAW6_005952 [Cyclotella cf. meneghiniana]
MERKTFIGSYLLRHHTYVYHILRSQTNKHCEQIIIYPNNQHYRVYEAERLRLLGEQQRPTAKRQRMTMNIALTKAFATAILAMLRIGNINAFAPSQRVSTSSFDLPRSLRDCNVFVQDILIRFHEKKSRHLQMKRDTNSIEEYDVEDEYTPLKFHVERRKGNYLDVLALSVIVFFLATTWLSHGELFSDYSRIYEHFGGTTSVYNYVDADSVLREDFTRESSSVMF